MATPEEERIHAMWLEGDKLVNSVRSSLLVAMSFAQFRENGLSDETIAAAFSAVVEDVSHDIDCIERGAQLCGKANRLGEAWIAKNGTSPLLEGYDE